MIPDWETNRLFLSDRLEAEFPALVRSLRAALNGTTIGIIRGTSGIWCRDYMPIQLDKSRFSKIAYSPDYLSGHEHLITPANVCRLPFMTNFDEEPIVLDGGNVVASRTKVILTKQMFIGNPGIEQPLLQERLEQIFQAECIFIEKEPYDQIGHSDGDVRFVAEDRVLSSDFSIVNPRYGERLRNQLTHAGFEVESVPIFYEKSSKRGSFSSAVGNYINFLRVGDVVVIPEYGASDDDIAVEKIRHVISNAVVTQIPCRSLAEKGGVLNCISWTIKDESAV